MINPARQAPPRPVVTYAAVVGRVVENRRTALGIRQSDIAKALSITQSAYSRLETGENAMSLGQLQIVGTCLKCTPNEILHKADQYTDQLRQQGVEIKNEKGLGPAILIGLALLAALMAASK